MTNHKFNHFIRVDKKLNSWLNRTVHRAICDALEIKRLKLLGQTPPKVNSDTDNNIWLATGAIMYLGVIFILLAKWAEGV